MQFRMRLGIIRDLKKGQENIIYNLLEIRHEFVQLEYVAVRRDRENK